MDIQRTWMLLQIIHSCGNDPAFAAIGAEARKLLLAPPIPDAPAPRGKIAPASVKENS